MTSALVPCACLADLPDGGTAVLLGDVPAAWGTAAAAALGPPGRVVPFAVSALGDGLDRLVEDDRLIDLDLLVIGADVDAGWLLAHGGRVIGIFQPRIVILDSQVRLHGSLLADLAYGAHRDGAVTVLRPLDEAC